MKEVRRFEPAALVKAPPQKKNLQPVRTYQYHSVRTCMHGRGNVCLGQLVLP